MAESVYFIAKHEPSDVQCRKGFAIDPKGVADLIRRARKPLLITGGKLLEDHRLVDFACEFYSKGIPIIATGASSKPLFQRGVKPIFYSRTLHYVVQYLLDGEWELNGDLILFLGFSYPYLSRMLSALKHFSSITTVSLDCYQPNATYSLTDFALIIREEMCIGCGNCVVVCPYNAIELYQSRIRDGRRIVIDIRFCADCEYIYCTDFCPYNALEFVKGGEVVYRSLLEILDSI